jgi:hypothetical protein
VAIVEIEAELCERLQMWGDKDITKVLKTNIFIRASSCDHHDDATLFTKNSMRVRTEFLPRLLGRVGKQLPQRSRWRVGAALRLCRVDIDVNAHHITVAAKVANHLAGHERVAALQCEIANDGGGKMQIL